MVGPLDVRCTVGTAYNVWRGKPTNKEERAARGLANFIRCHSGFRISRIELVYSLPPHGYKRIGSEFVH